jgi:hypothetical protein
MQNTIKVLVSLILLGWLVGCAYPQAYRGSASQANTGAVPQGYVKLPPRPQAQPRRVIIRTETHRVLTPQVIMEPCCRMQPDVIYLRKP